MRWEEQPNDGISGDSYYYNPPLCQHTEYYGYIFEWEKYADIGALDIANAAVKLSQTKYTYSGDAICPGKVKIVKLKNIAKQKASLSTKKHDYKNRNRFSVKRKDLLLKEPPIMAVGRL